MSENSSSVAVVNKPRASVALAAFMGMAPDAMIDVLKAQCFKCKPDDVTDGQMAAFVSIANEMQVNPLLPGMLYAFPIQGGGIVPMMGPDGVFKKLAEHPNIDAWETVVYPEDVKLPPTHATSFIFMRGRSKPLTKTCLFSEWKMASNPNWTTRPRHMLEMRTLKQNSRQVIHGIPFDEDERKMMGEIDVTHSATGAGQTGAQIGDNGQVTPPAGDQRSDPPARANKKKTGGASTIPADGKKEEPPIDITATPPGAATGQQTTLPTEADPLASAGEQSTAKPTVTARTSMNPDERIELECEVLELTPQMIKVAGVPTPSVSASVKGGYEGTLYHFGGGKMDGEKVVPLPVWQVGAKVSVKLFGRYNKNSKQTMTVVEGVNQVEGAPALEVS